MTYFYLTLAKICHTIPVLRRPFWRYVYQGLAERYRLPEWTFMNYGYVAEEGSSALTLKPEDEANRNLVALYHHVANATEMEDKQVLEVGCGRGGGASYVARYLSPDRMIGIDISDNAIQFCRTRHDQVAALEFRQGDAEALPFEDDRFDAVLNVESSHCYGSIATFFSEVHRVLRPGGAFVYADFRPTGEVGNIESQLISADFTLEQQEDITANVLTALDQDSATKEDWIADLADTSLQTTLRTFAAISGTKLHQEFEAGQLKYFRYLCRKV
jgi:ubiquinone/menaquinone biosynthesis C-methylase UbiE